MGGSRETKAERKEAHRIRMEMKKARNAMNHDEARPFVLANMSRNHPEFGEQPHDQARRMLEKSS